MLRHIIANALTILIVVGLAASALGVWGVREFSAPGPLEETQRFSIAKGATIKGVSETLEENGVISNAALFRIGARYGGVADKLKFGEYEIEAGASMEEVLDIIVTGKSLLYRITLAEGLTSWEIVQVLNESEILTGEIESIPPEGSLAPDTYFVARGADRAEILARMTAAQEAILAEAWEARDPDTPLKTPEEALILASIIEKETGLADERPEVGGVFVNRLRRGMRLQSDPTIIYGITKGEGPLDRPIRRSDINRRTDYNTYQIDRLPAGPIANPGRDAIMAAVKPAETKALYFVADGTGGHAFAETLQEHNRNVAAWRKIEKSRQ